MKEITVIDTERGNVSCMSKSAAAKLLKMIERKAHSALSSSTARHIVYAIASGAKNDEKEIHIIPFTAYTDAKFAACFKNRNRIPFAVHK